MDLKDKIERIVAEHFRDSRTDLEVSFRGRVGGHIITPEFDEIDYDDRRHRVKALLREHLTPEEQLRISTLFFFTPYEYDDPEEEEAGAQPRSWFSEA